MLPKKENGQPVPLREFFQKGFITRKEYYNLTESILDYTNQKSLRLNSAHSVRVANLLGESVGIVKIGRMTMFSGIRVDTEVMDLHLGELKQAIETIRNSAFPQRSAEEISEAQKKILRIPLTDESLQDISFEEAYRLLMDLGTSIFSRWNLASDADSLAQDAIIKALPYLYGQRGDFNNIYHFRDKFYRSILRSVRIDHIKNNNRERNARKKAVLEESQPSEELVPSQTEDFTHFILTPKEKKTLELRMLGLKYDQIAKLMNETTNVIKKRMGKLKKPKDQK